ncbi:MAG TPA: PQQ-binding-like beta-propeller repeat protein [Caulifigura sp.]|nr:PQQ-binding-like beta-propeller repeat protein [Caulifigura sp.]
MSRLPVVIALLASCLSAFALQSKPPRIAIIQTADDFTHALGLSEFLDGEKVAYTDFSADFEAGTLPDLGQVDVLIVGSFVTNDPQKRAAYGKAGKQMQDFVARGGVVAVLDQADQDLNNEAWIPAPHRLKRTDPDSAAAYPLQPKHPLLTAAEPVSAADLRGWRTPVTWRSENTVWEALGEWSEAAVILGTTQSVSPKAAGLVETGWGKGRAVFYAMAVDKAVVCGNEPAKKGSTKLLRNLLAYSALVKEGRAPAIQVTEPSGFKHPIEGVVFRDDNSNGTRDAGEAGIAGIALSDGHGVVTTNGDGAYRLTNVSKTAAFVFVHQTSDYRQEGQSFFKRLSSDDGPAARFDFPLQPVAAPAKGPVRFVQLTDSHIRGVSDRNYMIQATSEIYAMDPPPDFVVATGDLVDWGVDEHFQNYVAGMQKPTVPYFNVFGNHEIHMGPLERYHQYIGPDYYSFERNGVLFLSLNCVTPSQRQSDWLKKTLELLGKGRPVVVFQHFPPTVEEMERFAKLNVESVFSGHWHSEKEHEHAGVQSINSPTFVMGGIDASPAGFKIVELKPDGSAETEWRYGFQNQLLTVVSPQKGSPADATYFPVIVNAYHTSSNVAGVDWRLGSPAKPAAKGSLKQESATSWTGSHGHSHPHPHPHPDKGASKAAQSPVAPGAYPFEVTVRNQRGTVWTAEQNVDLVEGAPAKPEPKSEWPMFMGGPAHVGFSESSIGELPLRLAWSIDTGGDPDFSSPILADGRLYLSLKKRTRGRTNGVAAFNPVTGERLWQYETEMAVNHTPAFSGGVLCIAEMGGRVKGIEAATGKKLWQHDLIDSDGRFSYCAPAVHEGAFYVGVMRRFAKIRAADGHVDWEGPVGKANSDWISSYGSPAVSGGRVVMSGHTSPEGLCVMNETDGARVWGHPADGGILGSAAIADGRVLFATNKSNLRCHDLNDGRELWSTRLSAQPDSGWSATTPAVRVTGNGEGIVVAGSGDGCMNGINLADGKVLWTHTSNPTIFKVSPYRRDDRPLLSSPMIAGDQVFFGSADGRIYGLDLKTGQELWTYVIGVPVMSTPLVTGNVLYVAAYDGRIYAFTSQSGGR